MHIFINQNNYHLYYYYNFMDHINVEANLMLTHY